MTYTLATRMKAFQSSIFSELGAYKKEKIAAGHKMIDLSIGNPDMPPADFVREAMVHTASAKESYGYTLSGIQEFHEAVTEYYNNTHNVILNSDREVLLLMGSQDGLVHLPMVYANPGDIILVPDPGYTAYETGIQMAGATSYYMPLKKENDFLPNLQDIPEEIAEKAKMMILNFPGNPVPAMAHEDFFKEVIAFAKKHQIIVVHDFAYAEFYFDGKKPISFLSVPGAKEVGVEINSLSKSYSLAGSRIGYMIGNEEIVGALTQFKSNTDYGVFLPIQKAASAALRHGTEFCEKNRGIYQERRDTLVDGFRTFGWDVDKPAGSMFVWAEIPKGWTSLEFAYALMDRANVVVTPGHAFGPHGEGFVRIALVQDKAVLQQVVENIKNSGIFSLEKVDELVKN
ncbi:LL-diaminopimelate aminotransferase [Bacillus paramycoides]|uniref:Aminotransferase n=1 Tax=Bacillus paramycoides TaxID=2026194 RepID=A0A1J9VR05_9BACI|nr:LL-diaminopimelate aminotransferase [Bacillus paramycoides]MED1115645.1 LL-diaminopimelate aminotransferase [Bacillus paramycoides]MED1559009.1 LL-diaminopimelate aminotransferase [Bacillus paramycoides]NWK69430.1 LL-diaminopimelate aminotransferase [Bacillus paramycoides]OJD77924.1 LL-diaminopimelate aminotransferase [Bacillus paramycoides]